MKHLTPGCAAGQTPNLNSYFDLGYGLGFAFAIDSQPLPATPATPTLAAGEGRHSPDFRSVYWFGTTYGPFTPLQAAVVRILWEAWENQTPDVSSDYLLERAGSDTENRSLSMLFTGSKQGRKAWGTLIAASGKGIYRLAEPARERPAA